jgi:hypothetical protein
MLDYLQSFPIFWRGGLTVAFYGWASLHKISTFSSFRNNITSENIICLWITGSAQLAIILIAVSNDILITEKDINLLREGFFRNGVLIDMRSLQLKKKLRLIEMIQNFGKESIHA